MSTFDKALNAAVLRGYQKIEAELQRKEAEQAAAKAALRAEWNLMIERMRALYPEILRPYLTVDINVADSPPKNNNWYPVIFDLPGRMAPIKSGCIVSTGYIDPYSVPDAYIDYETGSLAYSWYKTSNYEDPDIALAMASEEGMRAYRELDAWRSKREHENSPLQPQP